MLGRTVDRAALAATWRGDVEGVAVERLLGRGRLRQGYLIGRGQSVVGEQELRPEDAVEEEETPHKIGLAAAQLFGDDPRGVHDPSPAEVLAIEGALRGHQLVIELGQRQPCRQHRMLNIVQPVVAAGDPATLGHPAFGTGIGCVDADIYDFGQLDTPFSDNAEALMVPIRVGNQVDRDHDPQRAGVFERLEIAAERNSLAMLAQSFFVDRLEADKHVFEAELFPMAKYILVAQQYVAASLKVIFLTDAGADDRFGDLHAVPLLYESDIVDHEDAGFPNRA